jgi:hypothetical protein
MFGQEASSHTVCSLCSRSTRFTSRNRGLSERRTRIHAGFRERWRGLDLDHPAGRQATGFFLAAFTRGSWSHRVHLRTSIGAKRHGDDVLAEQLRKTIEHVNLHACVKASEAVASS